jgi:hypothetical protein
MTGERPISGYNMRDFVSVRGPLRRLPPNWSSRTSPSFLPPPRETVGTGIR